MYQSTVISKACGSVVETLEARRLFHAALDVTVNFQPIGVTEPPGTVADSGRVFADRGNGYTYGWNADNTANTRVRNSSLSPSDTYDTLIHSQKNGNFVWEMALENGDYKVRLVSGDAGYSDSVYKLNVEGVLTVNGTPTNANRWVEGTQIVTVTDGKLTISNAAGAVNNRLCFVEIQSYENLPVVSISASDADAAEPNDEGAFTISRTGSTHDPLTVNYMIGGSAEEGTDYESLSGQVTIGAGSSSARIEIEPLDDLTNEQLETIVLTIAPGNAYELGNDSATVNLADNDVPDQSGGIGYRINFQTANASVPPYNRADTGAKYGTRANGLTYGWSVDNSSNARQRTGTIDQRYLSFNHMQKGGDLKWEMALPNGMYTVRVVAGDPDYTDGTFKVNVENILTVSGSPSSSNHFIEGTKTVSVSDGRLTLTNAAGASGNKIVFVEIKSGSSPIPVVSIKTTDATASEAGNNPGYFTVTRAGSTASSLTVNYAVSGSATNSSDYVQLFSSVTIPAGQASAQIKVSPHDDSVAEGTENVKISLSQSTAYSTALNSSAALDIADNDTSNTGGTLNWTTRAKGFARAESLSAVVGGKLYVLGGYINGKYLSSKRFDVYDPSTNKWTQLPDMPQALTHAGCAYDDRYIYVAGGYSVNDAGTKQIFAINNVRRYDTQTGTWKTLPNLPQPRGGGSMAIIHDELVFIGGSDINRADKADVWELRLNDVDDGWRAKASLPEARNHFAAVSYNDAIYAIGGQTGQDATSVFKRSVFKFNEDTNTWTRMADMINQARSHIAYASFVHNGKIIVAGGETDSGTPNKPKILNNVEQYDPATNKWSSLKPLPASRTSGVAGSFGDKIIYATGSTGSFVGDTWIGTFG